MNISWINTGPQTQGVLFETVRKSHLKHFLRKWLWENVYDDNLKRVLNKQSWISFLRKRKPHI